MGLLDRPDGGEYFLAGQPVHGLDDEQMAQVRNRLIGFVFQHYHLIDDLTVAENLDLPLSYRDISKAEPDRQFPQVGHRQPIVAADIDAAKQSDPA